MWSKGNWQHHSCSALAKNKPKLELSYLTDNVQDISKIHLLIAKMQSARQTQTPIREMNQFNRALREKGKVSWFKKKKIKKHTTHTKCDVWWARAAASSDNFNMKYSEGIFQWLLFSHRNKLLSSLLYLKHTICDLSSDLMGAATSSIWKNVNTG